MKVETKKFTLDEVFHQNPAQWVQDTARDHQCKWGFLIADDQVGFCAFDENRWVIQEKTKELFSPEKFARIQQLYLFGPSSQVFLWREGGADFKASLIREIKELDAENSLDPAYMDETYYFWGSAQAEQAPENFTRLAEKERGFSFDIPIVIPANRQAGFGVRHYFREDEDGQVTIAYSRLIDIVEIEGGNR